MERSDASYAAMLDNWRLAWVLDSWYYPHCRLSANCSCWPCCLSERKL